MSNLKKRKQTYVYYTYLPMLLGIILGGVLYIIMSGLDITMYNLSIDNDYLSISNLSEISYKYIIKQRIMLFVAFVILQLLFSYKFTAFLMNMIFGLYYIFFSVRTIIEYGMEGLLFSLILFLPYFLFYFNCVCLIGKWFSCNYDNNNFLYERFNNFNFFVKVIIIIVMLLLGVVFEIFFQKFFQKI